MLSTNVRIADTSDVKRLDVIIRLLIPDVVNSVAIIINSQLNYPINLYQDFGLI
jgi:hypothetical protein